jgi:glycosyltransferase involved in cell wall biosynthesis
MSDLRTLVIIPAKNEGAALGAVLESLRATVGRFDVAVVDDGSTDDTAAVAQRGGATVLSLPYNLGIGGALRLGFRYAVAQGYDRAVQFDGDGQHDASQIAALLAALDAGANMAIGNRFAPGDDNDGHGDYDVSAVRGWAMGLLRLAVRQFTGRRFTDTSSGFRAFDAQVLIYFAHTYPAEYMESVEALMLACRAGFRVDEVPVRMHARSDGVASTRNLRLVYHYLRLLLVMTASVGRRRPHALDPATATGAAP